MMDSGGVAALVVERAAVGDAAAILGLQRLAYQREAERYHDPRLPSLVETLAELAAVFTTHVILKAVVDGAIVGSVRARCDDHICAIGRLMVHPRLQGHGLGTALMRRIEAHFPDAERFQLCTGARRTSSCTAGSAT